MSGLNGFLLGFFSMPILIGIAAGLGSVIGWVDGRIMK